MMTDLDVAVIGAGFSGLAALHLLREQGMRVRAFDEAGEVGGTWWWHAYPGPHLDTECHLYQYFFSEALYREWGWSERHPAGYEVQRWLRFVADRLDLRRDVSLATRVVGARHDGEGWTLRTDRDEQVRARHLVACPGRSPVEPAVDTGPFAGLVVRTAAWPEDGHDLAGRRVGIVGTTSATVQLVPAIVERVAHLTVVADGPVDVVPRVNPVYGWREREAYRARFADLPGEVVEPVADRGAMRARVADDRLAALLIPDGPAGRVTRESGYLEVFARGDADLCAAAEVARVRPEGLARVDGTVVELDVLVVADEFDSGPPALNGLQAHPSRHTVVARPGRTPCLDLQEQVAAVVGTLAR